jgi:type VI secretion system ImpA family protein
MNEPDRSAAERIEAERIQAYFRDALGTSLDALLAPVPGDAPEGAPAADDQEGYRRIRHARQEEDASLPLGAWERELKRADWDTAAALSVRALIGQGKDLQLAAWLLEASIARSGYPALAPCLHLVAALFDRYGERLHPRDPEHRLNQLVWIGQKLLPSLRRVTITATGSEREFAWSDWEQALRNEQLRASLGRQRESEIEGVTLEQVGAALASTPQGRILFLLTTIGDALQALARLERTVDAHFGADAPGFGPMRDVLERVENVLQAECRRRGLNAPAPAAAAAAASGHDAEAHDAGMSEEAEESMIRGNIDRRDVYAALAEIAQVLERIEPHSPVPYLIRRAVAWGGLNTAELYSEVFVRCGGQINIFELLGLADPVGQERATAG